MRIWVISSGYEHLPLLPALTTIDCQYDFFVDREYSSWSEKSPALVERRIAFWLDYLLNRSGVEQCIVPALREDAFLKNPAYASKIMPLYTQYIHNHCLPRSLVWKLWVATTTWDYDRAQKVLSGMISGYALSDKQQATRSFITPFAFWTKAMPTRSLFLQSWSKKDWMVRKSIKHDNRYFHDAWIDTLIPTTWTFLYYEKILTHQLNRKKIKFHWIYAVKKELAWLVTPSTYSVTIHATDSVLPWLEQKKRTSMLTRWGTVEITINYLWE